MIPYHRVAGRFFNRPLFLTEDTAEAISLFFLNRMTDGALAMDEPSQAQFVRSARLYGDAAEHKNGNKMLPYHRTTDGVAIIPVIGELVNRGGWVGASSGLVSYEGLSHQLNAASNDPDVHSILLDIESPGGEAIGCSEMAAKVRDVAAKKHVTALVNGMAASAGYAVASGANRIVTLPTGMSGSIGCFMLHLDFSEHMKDAGIKPTFIKAGAHKTDGNPYESLSPEVAKKLQAGVDNFYESFLQSVAAGRGNRLTYDMARATEARTYLGEEAVKLGLADEMGTLEDVLSELSQRGTSSRKSHSKQKGISMSENKGAPAANNEAGTHDHGVAMHQQTAAIAKARAEGVVAGRDEAYARLSNIIGMDKVKGHEMAAIDLAMKAPDMSAEDVVSFVSQYSKQPSVGSSLVERMAQNSANLLRPENNVSQAETVTIDVDAIYAKMNA